MKNLLNSKEHENTRLHFRSIKAIAVDAECQKSIKLHLKGLNKEFNNILIEMNELENDFDILTEISDTKQKIIENYTKMNSDFSKRVGLYSFLFGNICFYELIKWWIL